MTRLGDFQKFLSTNLITYNEAQIVNDFLAILKIIPYEVKTAFVTFRVTLDIFGPFLIPKSGHNCD